MSIRLRFTLLYTVILAVTLTFFGATLYTTQSQGTLKESQTTTAEFARRVAEGRRFAENAARFPAPPAAERAPQTEDAGIAPPPGRPEERQSFREQGMYLQVRDAVGAIVFQSGSLEDMELPLSVAALQAVRGGQPWVETVTIQNEHVLVHSEPSRMVDGQLEIVQVAVSLEERDQTLRALGRNLALAGGIVVVVAFAIGWLFSGYVLSPIQRIRRTAEVIGEEQDFDRRVEVQGPNDEVAQLASTFNTMLAQLQVAYRRVEAALHMQRRFVADVSHELRTPLTTIRGNIELLRRVPPIRTEDQSAVVKDIVDETERMIRLVNDLLMLEHSDAGQQLRSEPILVGSLARDTCQQVGRLEPQRKVLCADVDDSYPGRRASPRIAVGDPDALKQVLLILLDNAITHTAGDVQVETATENSEVVIRVRDQGPGIPPETLPHIFDRFYRGDEARSKPGTGLGLAIAKTLVERQGGTIQADSQVDQGTVFTVTLPHADVANEEA